MLIFIDLDQKVPVLDGSVWQRLMQPSINAAANHLKSATHRYGVELMSVIADEAVLYSDSLAKYYAAMFRRPRSFSIRRI